MSPGKRIDVLDGGRSLAVLAMCIWHFFWDLTQYGILPADTMDGWFSQFSRAFIVCSFIVLSGISCRFSRSNFRRCLRLALCALLVSAVTALAGDPVRFGVLHLLAAGAGLWGLWEKSPRRLPEKTGVLLCGVLFAATFFLPAYVRVTVPWLYPLGLRTETFCSADYYPLLPWAFLFFAGAELGGRIKKSEAPLLRRTLPPALTWPGRKALWIYLLHQPLLLGLLALLTGRTA